MDSRHSFLRIPAIIAFAGVFFVVLAAKALPAFALVSPAEIGKAAGKAAANAPKPTPFQVNIIGNTPKLVDDMYDSIDTQLTRAAVVAFFNAAQTFAGQMAYDVANYIASGFKAQGTAFYQKDFGQYLTSVSEDAAGDFIGALSDDRLFRNLRLNFCRPSDPTTLLRLQLSLGGFLNAGEASNGRFQRPRPKCTIQDLTTNWQSLASTLSNKDWLKTIEQSLNPNANNLGVGVQILGQFNAYIGLRTDRASLQRFEGKGFRPVANILSGNIRTPAEVVRAQVNNALVESPKTQHSDLLRVATADAFKQGSLQLLQYTASMFVNTLGSKLIKRIFERGLDVALPDLAPAGPEAVISAGSTDARRANIDLQTPNLQKSTQYDALSDFISCPEDSRGPWNCVMDQSFAQALRQTEDTGSLTIRAAIEKKLLHGDWKLIPASDVRANQDPFCYTKAYCAGNLQKLRLLRVLPVGFEYAANAPANFSRCSSGGDCVTLGQVVDGFSDCNSEGKLDAEHPWCHLIDPNWILTMIPQQCAVKGFGNTLVASNIPQRQSECQDVQTCLRRDNEGNCVGGYGYCLAEKTVYRIRGDECPARYATCQAYTDPSGSTVGYLANTLDRATCSAENAGCLWYATTRDTSTTTLPWIGTTSTGPRMYFDHTFETCSASGEGCTRLLPFTPGESALNLVANSSFEKVDQQNKVHVWETSDATLVPFSVDAGTRAVDGMRAAGGTGTHTYEQRLDLVGAREYTVSLFARTFGVNSNVSIGVTQYNDAGLFLPIGNTYYDRVACNASGQATIGFMRSDLGTEWKRFECTFTSQPGAVSARISVKTMSALADAVQLEEGGFATAYLAGALTGVSSTYMKLAPEDLSCLGQDTDPAVCDGFARVCRQSEAGCQGYTDVRGGSEIPAIATTNDLCPAACVGYNVYQKQSSAFDLTADPDPQLHDARDQGSLAFIPSTAEQCRREDVGCEAFTNTEASTQGGETQAYFSYVRSCARPADAPAQTYFTWEGSDTAGYQLHTWSLVREGNGEGPAIQEKKGPGDVTFKPASLCNADTWAQGTDPDCRQFYDAAGRVFYRFYSQTILSTDQCGRYRLNRSNEDDCVKTGGVFVGATGASGEYTGQCEYRVYVPESRVCSARAAGCRAFAGPSSGNVQPVLTESFRGSAHVFKGEGVVSKEALLKGDTSLRLAGNVSVTSPFASQTRELYELTFWAKTIGGNQPEVVLSTYGTDKGSLRDIGTVKLGPTWQRFTIGPFEGASDAPTTTLRWDLHGDGITFLDELEVDRVQDTVYVRMNTWKTPEICDRNAAGVPQPQAMLGCRAYKNRYAQTIYARQFSQLCREEVIGCRAFIDTRNSTSTSEAVTFTQQDEPFNPAFGSTTVVRKADRYVYVIDEPSKHCQEESASCRAFGKPVFSADRQQVDRYETVYYKDDVGLYDQALCRPSELFCEAYQQNQSVTYFRNPQQHVCEYRENINGVKNRPANERYSGWFIQGVTPPTPCYPSLLNEGSMFEMARTGDTGSGAGSYQQWAGLCSTTYDQCTDFRDPNDTVEFEGGKPYYFLNNDTLDDSSCQGNVDLGKGCVLLQNTQLQAAQTYNTDASYAAYRANGSAPTPPVNCLKTPNAPKCPAACREENPDPRLCNNANMLMRVRLDRDCAQWLGCSSAETVFDPAIGRYKDLCTNLALCDRASQKTDDLYCGGYVNRSTVATEPILTRGAFFDPSRYASREVGLGKKDYAGYALPDAFVVADIQSDRMAAEGLSRVVSQPDLVEARTRRALEYRLATAVPIPRSFHDGTYTPLVPNNDQAEVLPPTDPIQQRYPELSLCRHRGSGRIGYYHRDQAAQRAQGIVLYCYLPLRGITEGDDFQNVVQSLALSDPDKSTFLPEAYPAPQCRSYPEADAPFDTDVVTRWDMTANPPKALEKRAGLEGANTCEQGESCACTYKRVEYRDATVSKFYNMNSQNIPQGLCVGGPRDGEACIPDQVFKSTTGMDPSNESNQQRAVREVNESQGCGPVEAGGKCAAFSKISIVRGLFGQCLEKDLTRTVGASRTEHPCLTWNPTPVLFGAQDPYHFVQTAGYNPPENAGQYYCTDNARDAKKASFDSDFFDGGFYRAYAGSMIKLSYDDSFVSAGGGLKGNWDNVRAQGASLDGVSAERTRTGVQCEDDADTLESNNTYRFDERYVLPCAVSCSSILWQANANGNSCVAQYKRNGSSASTEYIASACFLNPGAHHDESALRIVTTGSERRSSYAEYFLQINQAKLAKSLGVSDGVLDANLSYFTFKPILNQNGNGRLACGYQEDWVDDMGEVDYEDKQSLRSADREWQSKFNEGFSRVLSRGSGEGERLLQDDAGLIGMPCVGAGDKSCYFKTWHVGYRDENQTQKFKAFTQERAAARVRGFEGIRSAPKFEACGSDKPYFAIRAVFQTPKPAEGSDVQGPWQFVGFWVSACGGGVDDVRYIYMHVDAYSADVCREVAETRSVESKQDAAFTDRVWRDGNFSVPGLGIQYGARYSPFSSALNKKAPGKDPLYQSGGEAAGGFRADGASFIAGGVRTYYRDGSGTPSQKWAYISNLFARIYRIYTYYDTSVTKDTKICLNGDLKGKVCQTASVDCSPNGVCVSGLPSGEAGNLTFCNSLSGVNAGVACQAASDKNEDLCHRGAIVQDPETGTNRVLLGACVQQAGWTSHDGVWQHGDQVFGNNLLAAENGAFTCAAGTVRAGQPCTAPMNESTQCPLKVEGRCEKASGAETGVCRITTEAAILAGLGDPSSNPAQRGLLSSAYAACYQDTDCTFDEWSFWLDEDIPYKQTGDAGAWTQHLTNTDHLWGPIYSKRSSLNEFGWWWTQQATTFPYKDWAYDNYCLKYEDGTMDGEWNHNRIDPNDAATAASRVRGRGMCLWSTYLSGWNFTPFGQHMDDRAKVDNIDWSSWKDRPGLWVQGQNQTGYMDSLRHSKELMRVGAGETFRQKADGGERITGVLNAWPGGRDPSGKDGNPLGRFYFNLAQCESVTAYKASMNDVTLTDFGTHREWFTNYKDSNFGSGAGRCRGGVNNGNFCVGGAKDGSAYSCVTQPGASTSGLICDTPVSAAARTAGCYQDPAYPEMNNACIHEAGYVPNSNVCPDPKSEYCGLIAYDIRSQDSYQAPHIMATDVTLGHYTPGYFGYTGFENFDRFTAYYTPRPPRIAAPDIKNCPTPGQCAVQRMDQMSFEGQSEGVISATGGQYKGTIRFYAWAAHNQMPMRRLVLDWGDGFKQELPDAKLKNHKPFCGVQKECYDQVNGHSGLTCQTDYDCPAGFGRCAPLGSCSERSYVACTQDSDCRATASSKETCKLRNYFGNTPEACETNYFEFSHVYTCDQTQLPAACAAATGYCSRNPGATCSTTDLRNCGAGDTCVQNMAPAGGCSTNNTCRFTPRILLEDNWGWCTGECRDTKVGNVLTDSSSSKVVHKYGGCYSGSPLGVDGVTFRGTRLNTDGARITNECRFESSSRSIRPWIVYPGSLQLRVR